MNVPLPWIFDFFPMLNWQPIRHKIETPHLPCLLLFSTSAWHLFAFFIWKLIFKPSNRTAKLCFASVLTETISVCPVATVTNPFCHIKDLELTALVSLVIHPHKINQPLSFTQSEPCLFLQIQTLWQTPRKHVSILSHCLNTLWTGLSCYLVMRICEKVMDC